LETLEDRLTPSGGGLLDTTFNGTGEEVLSSSVMHVANDVAVQPDGRIVSIGYVATRTSYAIQVARMNANGTLDTTFNGTGTATLTFGTQGFGEKVALQPDGKILVGGEGSTTQTGREYVVARLNANGSLDTTFGNTGKKGGGGGFWAYNVTSSSERLVGLAALTDSSNHPTGVMIGGQGYGADGGFEALKLTTSGVLDTTFGTSGVAEFNGFGVGNVFVNAKGMAVTPSGGVVMVGAYQYGVIAAFTSSGQRDTGFNGTGYRVDNISGANFTYFDAVAVQPSTGGGYRLVVAGTASLNARNGLVVGYTSGGQFDSTFGTGGVFTTTAAAEFSRVALEADGSIVAAGYAYWTNPSGQVWQQIAVGHLSADGTADTTFGTGGTGISLVTPLYTSGGENAYSLAIDPSGRIVVTFETGVNSDQAALLRLTAP
jgi:uncharacterized delta-60 repeat protein